MTADGAGLGVRGDKLATSPCICEHAGPGVECVCHPPGFLYPQPSEMKVFKEKMKLDGGEFDKREPFFLAAPDQPAREQTCNKPMRGLYGAATICARPVGHLGRHNPVWDYRDWPRASVSAEQPAREQAAYFSDRCGRMFEGTDGVWANCALLNGHDGPCVPATMPAQSASVSADTPPTTLTEPEQGMVEHDSDAEATDAESGTAASESEAP